MSSDLNAGHYRPMYHSSRFNSLGITAEMKAAGRYTPAPVVTDEVDDQRRQKESTLISIGEGLAGTDRKVGE